MEAGGSKVPGAWRVSLHGGHSGSYCGHASGRLEDFLVAAIAAGFKAYGISEHAPRSHPRLLYRDEIEAGWDISRLKENFDAYTTESNRLVDRFAGQLTVLRGFEAEVVPGASWAVEMSAFRQRGVFDYVVGSVHHVDEIPIDYRPDEFAQAVAVAGGVEALAIAYYETVTTMAEVLRPEVVGHLDLIRKFAAPFGSVDTPAARAAAERALEAVAAIDAIIDVNTSGLRVGLGHPYPAPWIVERARDMGIAFCFGDDSHSPLQVGAGVDAARDYLLELGVREIEFPDRSEAGDEMVRRRRRLDQ